MSKKQKIQGHQILHVLGNRYRNKIAKMLLADKELNVGSINAKLNSFNGGKISQPAVSQHLMKMRSKGILKTRRDQREIFYSVTNPSLIASILRNSDDLSAKVA